MKKVKLAKMDIFLLQNAEFSQLMTRLVGDIEQSGLDTTTDADFSTILENLKNKIPTFNKALNQIRENELTQNLSHLDKIRKNDLMALRDSIKPYKNAKKEQQKQAYNALKIIFDEYKKTSINNYESETHKLKSLIDILKSSGNKSYVSTLKIGDFISELETSNQEFDRVFALRSVQNIGKETYDTKSIRREMTELYRKLCIYTETLADIKQEEFYKKALEVINNSRKYFSDTLSKRKGKKQSEKKQKDKKGKPNLEVPVMIEDEE